MTKDNSNNKKTCERCGKLKAPTDYYKLNTPNDKHPDGLTPICKICIGSTFKGREPETFMPVLALVDVPWLPTEYETVYNSTATPMNPNNISILGKYIGKMKLSQYKKYKFLDSDEAQALIAGPEKFDSINNYQYDVDIVKPMLYSSSSQFVTDDLTEKEELAPPSAARVEAMENIAQRKSGNQFDLTADEMAFLIAKWGVTYNNDQLIKLERKYMEMSSSYDIQTAMDEDYLCKACRVSVLYDEALDGLDMDSASKLSKMFTSITKEARFQPIQNESTSESNMDAVGHIVRMCEKGGPIPRWDINEPMDQVDLVIKDLKLFNKSLVANDDTIHERHLIDQANEELRKQEILEANGNLGADGLEAMTQETLEGIESIDMDIYKDIN